MPPNPSVCPSRSFSACRHLSLLLRTSPLQLLNPSCGRRCALPRALSRLQLRARNRSVSTSGPRSFDLGLFLKSRKSTSPKWAGASPGWGAVGLLPPPPRRSPRPGIDPRLTVHRISPNGLADASTSFSLKATPRLHPSSAASPRAPEALFSQDPQARRDTASGSGARGSALRLWMTLEERTALGRGRGKGKERGREGLRQFGILKDLESPAAQNARFRHSPTRKVQSCFSDLQTQTQGRTAGRSGSWETPAC